MATTVNIVNCCDSNERTDVRVGGTKEYGKIILIESDKGECQRGRERLVFYVYFYSMNVTTAHPCF